MATINLETLEAAFADKLVAKRLSKRERLYLHHSVITANSIYWAIAKAEDGLDSEQLLKIMKPEIKSLNTLFQFARWLQEKGLIVNESKSVGKKNLYFTSKHRFSISVSNK